MNKYPSLTTAMILGLLLSIQGLAQTGINQPNWERILKTGQSYFDDPTSANALELYKALPKAQVRDVRDEQKFRDVFYFFDAHLGTLERQVLLADRNAVKIAVRLWTISDGAFSEVLASMLGDLIQVDPKMFIEEIREFPWPKDYGDFDEWLSRGHILCAGGIEVGKEIWRKKMASRIQALESVTDGHLVKSRDKYISAIKNCLQYIRGC